MRLAQIEKLSPPVDVVKLAKKRAHLEEKHFPIDVDGLCLDLKVPGRKPRIWINARLRHHRKRFTLAHEIGHITIPWHVGTIVDELDGANEGARSEYRQVEAEANRFAAELLMPGAWSQSICDRAVHLAGAMHTIAQVADVSLHAAALRTIQFGPKGYLVAAERSGQIFWSARTKGTDARPPHVGENLASILMPAFEKPENVSGGETSFLWWKQKDQVVAPERPSENWRDILGRIVSPLPVQQRAKTCSRINAIIGCAFRFHPPGTEVGIIYLSCLAALQNRQESDPGLTAALSHADIQLYALARAYDRSN